MAHYAVQQSLTPFLVDGWAGTVGKRVGGGGGECSGAG